MSKRTITIAGAWAIIAATAVFHLATLRSGHDWGGDFALYIHHAENIVQGKPYADTGFIFNPYYPHLSPSAYPPVFPLMLVPIYKVWGLDLMAMKGVVVISFAAALAGVWGVFRRELPGGYTVALLGILAFNPWFWDFKDQVLSDIPFLFFMYAALFWLGRAYSRHEAGAKPWVDALVAGLFVCLAYGTRSLGAVLVLAAIGYDLIRYRRPTPVLAVVVGMFGVYAVVQGALIGGQSSYLSLFAWDPGGMLAKLLFLPLPGLWHNGYVQNLTYTLWCIITVLAVAGYIIRLRRGVTVLELIGPLYVLPLFLLQAFQGMRYVVPLIPLYVFYVFVALNEWRPLQRPDVKKTLAAGLCVVIFGSYAARYTTVDFGPIAYGPEKPQSQELFQFVRENTEPNDVLIFRKPRVLSLYTGRPSSIYPVVTPENAGPFWDHVKNTGARYIIAGEPFIEDRAVLSHLLRESGNRLEQVFVSPDFRVYRIKN